MLRPKGSYLKLKDWPTRHISKRTQSRLGFSYCEIFVVVFERSRKEISTSPYLTT